MLTFEEFLALVKQERKYQEQRNLTDLDVLNKNNDWVAAITKYAARGATVNPGEDTMKTPEFKAAMVKVATLAYSALLAASMK